MMTVVESDTLLLAIKRQVIIVFFTIADFSLVQEYPQANAVNNK